MAFCYSFDMLLLLFRRRMLSKLYPLNISLFITSTVGFALSYYTWTVESLKEHNDEYEAMCDISEHISCSRAFMSEYGRGFGLIPEDSILYQPNCIYGLIFYGTMAILSLVNSCVLIAFIIAFSAFSCIFSIYLAYVLFVLRTVCVVCVTTYIINGVILHLSHRKAKLLFLLNAQRSEKQKKF